MRDEALTRFREMMAAWRARETSCCATRREPRAAEATAELTALVEEVVATIAGEGGAGVAVGAVGLIIGCGIVIGLLSVLGGRWENEKYLCLRSHKTGTRNGVKLVLTSPI